MQINPKTDQFLHHKLPIDEDEKILGVYRHHWFAYVSSWVIGVVVVVLIMGLAIIFTSLAGNESVITQHKSQVIAVTGVFSVLVLIGTCLPVYLRSQEEVVLTEEALLQVLQPSLFASKIDQLSLQHITDVSVQQDFFGTVFGYGHITVETPGEQDNFEFAMLPTPHNSAREIVQAHENFNAALQAGRMPSTLGAGQPQVVPPIDPQQYQQFLAYQQTIMAQNNAQTPANVPELPIASPEAPQTPATSVEPNSPSTASADNQSEQTDPTSGPTQQP